MGIYSKIIDIQKLNMAWDRVWKNKPAPGVDAISCEEFEARKREELRQLNLELSEHRYTSMPVRLVQIYKEEKMRTIALFCMRDKVVQQSVALELGKLFEPKFSACSYAYRPGMSALQALEQISEKILSGERLWVLKMDIEGFFDNILHEKMKSILAESIREEDVLELVGTILQAPVMDTRSGEAEANWRGIFQGSGCAPILSNIYLMDYDREMEKRSEFYLRYSDDILVLESDEKKAAELLGFTKIFLEGLGLCLKESKTLLHQLSEQNGFDYLGYHFDENGKSIPGKAETTLQSRLETMWLTSGLTTKEKLKKAQEILGGWEQYYREERSPGCIIEYVALLPMVRNKEEKIRAAVESGRFVHRNAYKDVLQYMVDYWKDRARPDNILREYEQFFDVPEEAGGRAEEAEKSRAELLEFYQKLILAPDRELYVNMMQLYTDMGCYNKAAHFWELMSREEEAPTAPVLSDTMKEASEENFKDVNVHTYFETFVGRDDVYVREGLSGDGKRASEPVLEPLTEELVRGHLAGKEILGTYIQRQNATAKYLVIDVDISKKMLLQYAYDSEEFHACKKKAADTAQEIRKILKHLGLKTYLEDTGFRGYHVWLFFEEWIPVRYINLLSDYV
ncbi:MAG: hypothetical protein LUE92_02615 [Clostridiales bacterium]|nr:hypothetical protein [Clostridiales bacterium]